MDKEKEAEKEKYTTGIGGGLRFNHGKLRYDLVEPRAHRDMVDVLTMGANKYFDRNWENGLSWTSVIASLKRHLAAIEMGEDYDPESGRLHIAHVACNAHFLNTFYYTFPQGDDRPKIFNKYPKIGLDIDEVICNFVGGWMEEFNVTIPKAWYFDREIMNKFEAMRANKTLDKFYLNLKPYISPDDMPFEPHCYITSRPVSTELTEKWLDMNGFPCVPVYGVGIGESKVELAKKTGIEVFIDDKFETFREMNANGVTCFLFTAEHNKRYDVGHLRIDSLKDLPWFKK
jgi:5'(3')-deoxyribonucleotidase